MKYNLIYFLLLFMFFGCGASDDCDSVFKYSPAEYSLYLELKNGQDFFEDEVVEISNLHEMQNGVLAPFPHYNNEVIWSPLYQVENPYLNIETVVFGTKFINSQGHTFYNGIFVGMGPASPCGYDNRISWDKNSYYLVKFPDKTIDTIRIRNKKERFGFPKYTVYLNGVKTDYEIFFKEYITIQK